jgi:thiamine monophosphate kinase
MIEMELTRTENILPEQKIFRAVVSLAFEDAMSLTRSRNAAVLKSKAHRWFTNGGEDFILICSLAGLNSQQLKDKYLEMYRKGTINFTDKEIRYINSYWKFFNRRNKKK